MQKPRIDTRFLAIFCLFALVRMGHTATLVGEDFEAYSGGGYDGNGFANVGTTAGTSILGVTGTLLGDGWNGSFGSQGFLEIADAGISSALKAFPGRSADLNQNGLAWRFEITSRIDVRLSFDYGIGQGGTRAAYWEIHDATYVNLGVVLGATTPDQVGVGTQSFSTEFGLYPGLYDLRIGSESAAQLEGIQIDNVSLVTVPEPAGVLLLGAGGLVAALGRRRRAHPIGSLQD